MLKKVAETLKSYDNILITCHIRADGDTLGSAFALKEALMSFGKRVCIACDTPVTPKYRNMTDGVSELTEEFEPEHVVSVDVATEKLLGTSLQKYLGHIDLVIDHHPTNSRFGKINFVKAEYAATGEIIYEIIKAMGCPITKKIAEYIYIAVSSDTGCFRYSNTTAHSLRVAARLYGSGINAGEINRWLFETQTRSIIALQKMVFDKIHFYRNGTVAFLIITLDMIERTGVTEDDVESMTVFPRRIEGVEVGIVMREIREKEYKISARSNEIINVSDICQKFGGGGHKRAAGCTIEGDVFDIERAFAAEILKAFEVSEHDRNTANP